MRDEHRLSERDEAIDRMFLENDMKYLAEKSIAEDFGGRVKVTVSEQIEFAFNYAKQNFLNRPTVLILGRSIGAALNAELREARVNNNIEDPQDLSTFLGLKCAYVPTDEIKFEFGYERLMP